MKAKTFTCFLLFLSMLSCEKGCITPVGEPELCLPDAGDLNEISGYFDMETCFLYLNATWNAKKGCWESDPCQLWKAPCPGDSNLFVDFDSHDLILSIRMNKPISPNSFQVRHPECDIDPTTCSFYEGMSVHPYEDHWEFQVGFGFCLIDCIDQHDNKLFFRFSFIL